MFVELADRPPLSARQAEAKYLLKRGKGNAYALVQAINEARLGLGRYIPDEEAEALSERIAYWDYASLSKGQE